SASSSARSRTARAKARRSRRSSARRRRASWTTSSGPRSPRRPRPILRSSHVGKHCASKAPTDCLIRLYTTRLSGENRAASDSIERGIGNHRELKRTMIKRTIKTKAVAPAPSAAGEKVRFTCPCGAGLKVPVSRVNGHGRCPVCVQRLLLTGTKDRQGRWHLEAVYLGDSDASGSTFIIEGPPPATVRKAIVVKPATT